MNNIPRLNLVSLSAETKDTDTETSDGLNDAALNVEECRGCWLELWMCLLSKQPLNWSVGLRDGS
jgi:hypothetical protein